MVPRHKNIKKKIMIEKTKICYGEKNEQVVIKIFLNLPALTAANP